MTVFEYLNPKIQHYPHECAECRSADKPMISVEIDSFTHPYVYLCKACLVSAIALLDERTQSSEGGK